MKIRPLLFFLLISFSLAAQQEAIRPDKAFQSFDKAMDWVELKPDQTTTTADFFQRHHQQFKLDRAEDMQWTKTNTDQLGWQHHRYEQYYQGLRVEGGTYILHEKAGQVQKANGHIFPNISVSTQPMSSPEQIIDLALLQYPAEQYAWENRVAEVLLKRVKKDPTATHYPSPELVIMDRAYPDKSGQYALAYKLIIRRESPMTDRRLLYYDAHSGALLLDIDMMTDCHGGAEGTAVTRYHGERTIQTMQDSTGQYIMRDTTRGGGIETYNDDARDSMNNRLLFTDEDNFWNNFNPQQDEVAGDVHWGAAATYDYFLDNFNWNSYDNEGTVIISNVHVRENWNNATWNGVAMNFGDGDGSRFNPLTTIDIISHELTHGVTEFSSGLIYRNESGALNESFSDIFGKAVEAVYLPDEFNWLIGQRMYVNPDGFLRSMSNPNDAGDPKYYEGENWFTGTADNGGVHFNSGVQNFWYYLLVEGGQGTTESGYDFDVPALGFERATNIAFRNLTVYLTESSNYRDAWRGSLQAARDLYGHCSEEYLAVAEAWSAVGVGQPVMENDFELEYQVLPPSGCEIVEVPIEIILYNNSCNTNLTSGTDITVKYQVDNEPIVTETITLADNFGPGSTITYQFNQSIGDLSFGDHLVNTWLEVDNDPILSNDTATHLVVNRPLQNSEFSTDERYTSLQGVCAAQLSRTVFAQLRYDGCDTLPGFTNVPYQVRYRDQIINQQTRTVDPLAPLAVFNESQDIIMRDFSFGDAEFEVRFPGDPTATNNTAKIFIGRLDPIRRLWSEPFDNGALDSTRVAVEPSDASRNAIQEIDNNSQIIISGGNIFDDGGSSLILGEDAPANFYATNVDYQTTLHLCFNFRSQATPSFLFDYQHTKSDIDWEQLNVNPDYATMIMVEVNGSQDTILFGDAISTEQQTYRVDLREFAGDQQVEVKLITMALKADIDSMTNEILLTGDNIILDNLRLDVTTSTEDLSLNSAIQVTPNPSTQSFRLSLQDGQSLKDSQIRLVDLSGKVLFTRRLTTDSETFEFGHQLAPGVYFLQLANGEQNGYFKLVKQ